MVDAMRVDEWLLAVANKDQLLDPEKQEEWDRAENPEEGHDCSEKKSEEDYVEHKSVYELNLKGLALEVVVHLSHCFLFWGSVLDEGLPEHTVDDIDDWWEVEGKDGNQHDLVRVAEEPMSTEVNFWGSWGYWKQAVDLPCKLVENVVHWNIGVNLNVDQELRNPYHCKVEDEGDHYLRVQFQDLCRMATNCD